MTNKERYRRTFGALHVSDERLREVYSMKNHKKTLRIGRALLAAACVTALLTVSAFAANEVTDGIVFEKITAFVDGVMGTVTANGDGSFTIRTEDGNVHVLTPVEDNAVTSEDGDVYYTTTYEVELDDENIHQFEMAFENVIDEG